MAQPQNPYDLKVQIAERMAFVLERLPEEEQKVATQTLARLAEDRDLLDSALGLEELDFVPFLEMLWIQNPWVQELPNLRSDRILET